MPMNKIECTKYHNFGNSFIILDETRRILIGEEKKDHFAKKILSPDTGIGADGLVFLSIPGLQRNSVPSSDKGPVNAIDFVFRHFEPDGTESLMCLNGVLVTSLFVSQKFGKNKFSVLTSTNYKSPQLLVAGIDDNGHSFVEGLETSRVDKKLVSPDIIEPFLPGIDRMKPLEIQFRKDDITGMGNMDPIIQISGYIIFSGEPHLVIFTDRMSDDKRFTDIVFQTHRENRRSSTGDKFIRAVGMRVQNNFQHLFPKGLNITFARICHEPKVLIQYRCFERAINKETLSCGTAALACSSVAIALGLIDDAKTCIYPYFFNRFHPDSFYYISPDASGTHRWKVTGNPKQISSSMYCQEPSE